MNDPLFNAAATSAAKSNGATPATNPPSVKNAEKTAEEFEAVFLSQFLKSMTQDLGGAGSVAGDGGEVYRDMFTQEVAKMISRSGGIGVADVILQEMLKVQEIE